MIVPTLAAFLAVACCSRADAVQLLDGRDSDTVTMVLLDSNYNQLFDCWANLFFKSSSKRVLDVVALDASAENFVKAWGKNHTGAALSVERLAPPALYSEKQPKQPRQLFLRSPSLESTDNAWPSRWYSQAFWTSVQKRLRAGKHVLHSDVDAFFVNDPWPILETAAKVGDELEASLVSSADAFPAHLQRQNGFVMNTGFLLFRNTPETIEIVDEMIRQNEHPPKDKHGANEQFMLNLYLGEKGCNVSKALVPGQRGSVRRGRCGNVAFSLLGNSIDKPPFKAGGAVSRGGNGCHGVAACSGAGLAIVHGKTYKGGNTVHDICGESTTYKSPYG